MMLSNDLLNLADTMGLRAGCNQPLSIAEMKAVAALLRTIGIRVGDMENHPIPPTKRFPVIQGGGGGSAA